MFPNGRSIGPTVQHRGEAHRPAAHSIAMQVHTKTEARANDKPGSDPNIGESKSVVENTSRR